MKIEINKTSRLSEILYKIESAVSDGTPFTQEFLNDALNLGLKNSGYSLDENGIWKKLEFGLALKNYIENVLVFEDVTQAELLLYSFCSLYIKEGLKVKVSGNFDGEFIVTVETKVKKYIAEIRRRDVEFEEFEKVFPNET